MEAAKRAYQNQMEQRERRQKMKEQLQLRVYAKQIFTAIQHQKKMEAEQKQKIDGPKTDNIKSAD
jgi:hypothetical protein